MKNTTVRNKRPKIKDVEKIYGEDDYNSNDGMLTTVWGPGMWHYLHTMSFNYPVKPTKKDKKYYRDFVLSLQNVLPCGKCRTNFKKNLKTLPLYMKVMKNRETFSKYIFDLHELINKMLEKTSGLSYEVVRERYEHFRARCAISKNDLNKTRRKVRFSKKTTVFKEKGCTESLYGEKSKCVLNIVPQETKCETLSIDKQCIKHKNDVINVLQTNK